ncbi:MAG: hypothetical protein H7Y33_09820 [Cytophagales bacterium]|nr:hypothetical protein [Rhizobacter sp.]
MKPNRSWKRSVSLAALVAVACSTLQAATPSLERAATQQIQKPRTAFGQAALGSSVLRKAQLTGGETRAQSRRDSPDVLQELRTEPRLEPWSLIAGALGVIIFVAGRRRAD